MSGIFKTPIGQIEVVDVLFYFDGIRIFLGKNNENRYLGYLVQEVDEEEIDLWLFVPISEGQIERLLQGELSVRQAILQSEEGWVYQFMLSTVDENKHKQDKLSVANIPHAYLPVKDVLLRWK